MENLKIAYNSILYAIAILSLCFLTAISFEAMPLFGSLFSFAGFIAVAFCIFGAIAK